MNHLTTKIHWSPCIHEQFKVSNKSTLEIGQFTMDLTDLYLKDPTIFQQMHLHLLQQCAAPLSMYSSFANTRVFSRHLFSCCLVCFLCHPFIHYIPSKFIHIPTNLNIKLLLDKRRTLRRLVNNRRLLYLTMPMPDISIFWVLSQFLNTQWDSRWDAIIWILRYIKSSLGKALNYDNKGLQKLSVMWMQTGQVPLVIENILCYCVLFVS